MPLEKKHPIYDFLFEYYSFSPSRLECWSPGIGVVLEDIEEDHPYFTSLPFETGSEGAWLPPSVFPEKRLSYLRWLEKFLSSVTENPARFSCFGLHEMGNGLQN